MKITLTQILEALSHETLSFMSDSNHANGSINPDQIPKVIGRINAVIRRLNVRFVLAEKTVDVDVTTSRRAYSLTQEASYIVPSVDNEFQYDVNRILGIADPQGLMHNLNDMSKHDSIMLSEDGKSFALDTFLPSGRYRVVYKAATPVFDTSGTQLDQEIEIPEALLNALYVGVAAITYEGIGGPENIGMATSKWNQYEKECNEAKLNSAVGAEVFEDRNNFRDRGFR
jgi:hypothetical protein